MRPIENVIAATDLSASSLYAVDRGFLIAQASGARYTVMHVLALDALEQLHGMLGERTAAVSQRISDDTRETLMALVADPARNRGISANISFELGQAYSAIAQRADATGADLVLLGAHGQGFFQRLLLGSTTSRILRKSKCPVLVVKNAAENNYRRARVAVDLSPGSEHAIRVTKQLAPSAGIVLLHIVDIPFENKLQFAGVEEDVINLYRAEACERAMGELHTLASAAGLSANEYIALALPGDATRQILASEERHDCDLVVMGKHGTHVTEELLLGSATKRVLAESRSDVLVIVDKRKPRAETV